MRAALALAPLLLLAACGSLPRPFEGNPGAVGRILSRPPPARLAVPQPGNMLLPADAGRRFADNVTAALVAREVPAIAGPVRRGDWRLDMHAQQTGASITPSFTVTDPTGKPQGSTEGPPVAATDWAAAAPDVLAKEAAASAPAIATLLTRIDAVLRRSDPNSLVNRPPRVLVAEVTGAPGDGNRALAMEMRRQLPQLGEMVQDTPNGADFTVTGEVRTSEAPGGQTRVEISWHVVDAQGHDLGKVVQLNDVPAGTLNGLWGDVALVVAQQAAAGVKDVIDKQTGRGGDTAASGK